MAKTHKFAITVKLGGKAYAPGDDVPVGKGGLPDDQIETIEKVHGRYEDSPAGARAARGDETARHERELTALRNANGDLEQKLKAANEAMKLGEDRIKELEAGSEKDAERIAELEAEVAALLAGPGANG